jgi:hypothetical protein
MISAHASIDRYETQIIQFTTAKESIPSAKVESTRWNRGLLVPKVEAVLRIVA